MGPLLDNRADFIWRAPAREGLVNIDIRPSETVMATLANPTWGNPFSANFGQNQFWQIQLWPIRHVPWPIICHVTLFSFLGTCALCVFFPRRK